MPTIADRVYVCTRHTRECISCAGRIHKGERYRYFVAKIDGQFMSGGECSHCCKRYGRPIPAALPRQQLQSEEDTHGR